MRFCLVVFAAILARAQSSDTAAIRGQILDPSGASITSATVQLSNTATGLKRTVQSTAGGSYTLSDLPLTGSYELSVQHPGFALKTAGPIQLRAGEIATVTFTLAPESARSEVFVIGTVEGIRADSAENGTRLDSRQIQETPVLGRKLTTIPLLDSSVRPARGTGDLFLNNTLFVIQGGGRRQTSWVVDGGNADDAWGRQTIFSNIPLAAIQEVTVLTNALSSEYGRNTGGVVNVNTATGTNTFHGDFLENWRPGGIEARNPVAIRRTEDTLSQTSGMFAGPIVANKTHFLVSGEYNHQNHDAAITSPLAPGIYTGHVRQEIGLARLDQRLSDSNYLALRLSLDHLRDTNPNDAVGGNTLPSGARIFRRATYGVNLTDTAILTPRAINEARAEFLIGSPITRFDPVTPSTQYSIAGVATSGESRVANLQNHQWQLADTISYVAGTHNLKLGAEAIYSRSGGVGQEFGSPFYLGQFTLRPTLRTLDNISINDVTRFSQGFGNASYTADEWLGAIFLQDNWRVRPDLTLNLGLRYDAQTFTNDRAEIQPRFGFAYNFLGDRKTVLRGSYGLYYSQIRANIAAAYDINGPQGIFSFTASPGQLGFPTSLAPLPALPTGVAIPPRDLTVAPGDRTYLSQFFNLSQLKGYPDQLLNPRTQQFTVGVERQLPSRWILSIDATSQHTTRLDRTLDLNSPAAFIRTVPGQVRTGAAADATRPIAPVNNGYRRILSTVNDGVSLYNGLQTKLTRRFANHFSVLFSYTYSHQIDSVEPDAPNQDAGDANLRGRSERGDSLLDQRHRAVLGGDWEFARNWVLGSWTSLASARPYNLTTGVDNNGDNSTVDRPVINGAVVGRNAGRGTPTYDVQLFLERRFTFHDRFTLTARGEGFNLLNHENIFGRNGVYGNDPSGLPVGGFGAPIGGISNVEPGREFQFTLRLRF